MSNKSLPCVIGNCAGNLIPIDTSGTGDELRLRLRCSKCNRVTYFRMSLEKFFQLLEEREMLKK